MAASRLDIIPLIILENSCRLLRIDREGMGV